MRLNLASNNRMDIFETRRERLKLLIGEFSDGNQADFASKTKIKAPQINRWISNTATDRRNITEASARKLEKATGKQPGWLDLAQQSTLSCAEPEPAPYIEFDANIRAVITIMKRLELKYQEKIVFAAELVEADAIKTKKNHRERTGS